MGSGIRSPDARTACRRGANRRWIVAIAALGLLGNVACGGSGSGDSEEPATPAAITTNPAFVAAGSTESSSASRQLRVSVGSPLPVAAAAGASGGLALGPNAVRP